MTTSACRETPSTGVGAAPVRASRNACKLCTPLGACLAFSGVEGARTILHGSQGCATYIRRYMISHFKEPIDIASSSFGEMAAIYGGRDNLRLALKNVAQQYCPQLIGVATTCLAETIGDDVGMFLREIKIEQRHEKKQAATRPVVVHVSTPSYTGTHAEGYYATVRALVEQLAAGGPRGSHVNVFPAMFSPADLRYLKEICADFDVPTTILPDYSDTLDGPLWNEYELIPPGGTTLEDIRNSGRAAASIEFSFTNNHTGTASASLSERFGVPSYRLGLPIGVTRSDEFFDTLAAITGRSVPDKHLLDRGRLIDSIVDSHKHVFGRRAAVFGEEDLVVGIASLLMDIGVIPALCISGGSSGRLAKAVSELAPDRADEIEVHDGVDFASFSELISRREVDFLIGNSKGHSLATQLGVPLIRVGFPIHDRVGGARVLHIGYRGAQVLFDEITNAVIAKSQKESSAGYPYM